MDGNRDHSKGFISPRVGYPRGWRRKGRMPSARETVQHRPGTACPAIRIFALPMISVPGWSIMRRPAKFISRLKLICPVQSFANVY